MSRCALFESDFRIIFLRWEFGENWNFEIDLSVIKWESKGNLLPLSMNTDSWKRLRICYLEKVVEYRGFFYRLSSNTLDMMHGLDPFVRSFCNVQFRIILLNFGVWLGRQTSQKNWRWGFFAGDFYIMHFFCLWSALSSTQVIVSCGIKFSRMFMISSVKTDTCLFTSRYRRTGELYSKARSWSICFTEKYLPAHTITNFYGGERRQGTEK